MKITNFYLITSLIFVLVAGIAIGIYKDNLLKKLDITNAEAAKEKRQKLSPVKALSELDVYYPGTET